MKCTITDYGIVCGNADKEREREWLKFVEDLKAKNGGKPNESTTISTGINTENNN